VRMASLVSLLPRPRNDLYIKPTQQAAPASTALVAPSKVFEPPSYGRRHNFVPRTAADFGDGGAFPEIHVFQYPLDMGRKGSKSSTTQLTVDAEGSVQHEAIIRQGMRKDMVLYSQYTDLIEKDLAASELQRPSVEEEAKIAEKTRAALGKLVDEKVAAAQPTHVKGTKQDEPVFIRYTPQLQSSEHNSGSQQRIIRLQEMPVDPLEPPRFKHKKVPNGPPSPPAPVMHSPPRKVTAADQANWKIPPCISNWKNIKGYTIPLDKRLAADGRGLQEVQVNDKFAKLAESLFVAERTARSEIEARAQLNKNLARKQKEAKENELRELAARARAAGLARADRDREEQSYQGAQEGEDTGPSRARETDESELDARDQREELRADRRRELRRELRMENIKDEKKKSRAARDEERDVSEKIALGQATGKSKDGMFDQRLFNQSEGMSTGFGGDDSYDLYDKPLFKGSSASYLYRPKSDAGDLLADDESAERNVAKLIASSTTKFQPDKGFRGAERTEAGGRSKPVEFEADTADPYGLGEVFTDARSGRKPNALDAIGSRGHMSASGGGASFDRDSHRGSHKRMEFHESSSSSSSSSSSRSDRDKYRDDDRGDKRRRR